MFAQQRFSRAAGIAVTGLALVLAPTLHAQGAAKLDDPTIVAIFDAANTWDIETGNLGAKKATTKEIREFAAMIARDHAEVRKLGRDLAKKLGVTPTAPKDFALATEHAATMKKLNAVTGKEFDREFLTREVAFHQAVIDAVNNSLLPALKNQEVKDLVTKVAPAFKAHRDAAQNMADKLKA